MKCLRALALFTLMFAMAPLSFAQAPSTEERFQDVFITAGYATAFGAALGAACLSFLDDPQDHLQYVAVGASLGFIGGSILGTYVVLAPAITDNPTRGRQSLMAEASKPDTMIIRPTFNRKTGELAQLETAFTLLTW